MDSCNHDNKAIRLGRRCSTCYENERYAVSESYRERRKNATRTYYSTLNKAVESRKRQLRRIKQLYGLSKKEYNAIVDAHDGLCDLCHERPASHIDHDHETGRFRGLLCARCNLGLGWMETQGWTEKAFGYLRTRRTA